MLYLIQTILVLLLLTALTRAAKDFDEQHKENNNLTTFLPYTLKVKFNNKDQEVNKDLTSIKDSDKTQEKQALSLYEEQSDVAKPTTNNQWKRLTTYLPTVPTLDKYHEHNYLSKTPSYHLYEQHYPSQTGSLLGFPVTQMLSVLIQLAIISYILLGSLTLFHRLLSLFSPNFNTLSEGFSGNFYRSDLI